MEIALAISIPAFLIFVALFLFGFLYVNQRMWHERQMLALQKGLPLMEARPGPGSRSVALLWIALVVPVLCALAALGITIWAWSRPFWHPQMKWDITGIAWVAAGWTACVLVSTTAVIVAVRNFIAAARQGGHSTALPPNYSDPAEIPSSPGFQARKQELS